MNNTTQHRAYQRGVRVAGIFKYIKGKVLYWDQRFVLRVEKYRLPRWIGHIPMTALGIISVLALMFGGAIIAVATVLIAAVLLLMTPTRSTTPDITSDDSIHINNDFGTKYRSGPHGWGWYDSTGYMHDEDDN